jgi:ATP-dependent Clp protease adaptor protein ClpS
LLKTLLIFVPMAGIKTPFAPPVPIETASTVTGSGLDARVIVFNCECHTYEQVVGLFCQYIPGMTSSKAFELAWKIDHDGEAIVFAGGLTQAEEIAAKLAGGGLRVAVQ